MQSFVALLALSAVYVHGGFDEVQPHNDMYDFAYFCCFVDPMSHAEALRTAESPHWIAAMDEEVAGMFANGTWTIVDIDPLWNLLRSRWVYKRKKNKDGSLERYRALLVAKGFMQRAGIDYGEIFAPVVRYTTVRILFALCAHYGLFKRHFDAPKAFTQADLDTPAT